MIKVYCEVRLARVRRGSIPSIAGNPEVVMAFRLISECPVTREQSRDLSLRPLRRVADLHQAYRQGHFDEYTTRPSGAEPLRPGNEARV
jgi:hypothetical protein